LPRQNCPAITSLGRLGCLLFMNWLLKLVLSSLLTTLVLSNEHDKLYKEGDQVIVWLNTVGPLSNRQETYEYYQLPFCKGSKMLEHKHETLGEALVGMQLINSGMDIGFNINKKDSTLCEMTLTNKQVSLFKYAVTNTYWFSSFVDELPIAAPIGEIRGIVPLLYTHFNFDIFFNKNQIILVNLTMTTPVELEDKIVFAYSVNWKPTTIAFESRFDRYLDSEFFEHKIHWFSIFNSFMIVIFLTGLVSVILMRTLRRDLARYEKEVESGDRDLTDDYGWKQVHGDVFRTPPFLSVLSALCGTGVQLAVLAFLVTIYTMVEDLYME
jgi:transmembrane 9 superfamily protein 3